MARDAQGPRATGPAKPSLLEVARKVVDAQTRALFVGVIALQVVERLTLASGAIVTYRQGFSAATPIAIALALLTTMRSSLRLLVGVRVRRSLAIETARALLRRNLLAPCALEEEGGESVVAQEMLDLERLLSETSTGLLADAASSLGVAVLAAVFLPARLVASSAAGILLVALISELTRRRARRALVAGWESFAPLLEQLSACVSGASEIVGNGQTRQHESSVEIAATTWASTMLRGDVAAALVGRIPALAALLLAGIALYVDETSRGIPPLVAAGHTFVVAALLPSFVGVARSVLEIMRAESRTRSLELLLTAPAPVSSKSGTPTLPATIEWRDVSYAYPGASASGEPGPLAIEAVSIVWKAGVALGLAGPNGAGKSTLLRLLLGFDRPSSGEVLVDARPVRDFDPLLFRAKIAFVSQRPYFPRGSTLRDPP